VGIPPEDAQFLETRKFQNEEIYRMFRIPPHMVGDVSGSTSWGSGIEQQSIGFAVYTLTGWLVRMEQAFARDLFTAQERKTLVAKFVVQGLLRGNAKDRFAAYNIARQGGWMCGDDIRELEDLNPMPNGEGKVFLVNGNMVPVGQAGQSQKGQKALKAPKEEAPL
jgi:HK97 family phage portal protein